MGRRWDRLVGEGSRFAVVGVASTVVSFVLFNMLVHVSLGGWRAPLHDHAEVGYVIANVLGMLVSYVGTRAWAFRDRQPRHADGGVTAFVVINVATMAIPVACLWVSRNLLGLSDPLSDNVAANVIGLGLGFTARFWLFRHSVFERSRPTSREGERVDA